MTTDTEVLGERTVEFLVNIGSTLVSWVESNKVLSPYVGILNLSRDELLALGMYVALVVSFLVVAALFYVSLPIFRWLLPALFRSKPKSYSGHGLKFAPFTKTQAGEPEGEEEEEVDVKDVDSSLIAVDCGPRGMACITHHRDKRTPVDLLGDTSTALVLNALQTNHPILCNRKSVTCNHFDIDGYLSVLCLMYPQEAMRNADIIRVAAHIGDFREYSPLEKHADVALQLCCVINALERQHFARPFETHDSEKWPYFLNKICVLLLMNDPHAFIRQYDKPTDGQAPEVNWRAEYERVLTGHRVALDRSCSTVKRYEDVALCAISTPEPLHYYSFFGLCGQCDIVVSMLDNNRYEVEQRYSGYVNLTSRTTLPRLDMRALASQLNDMEETAGMKWSANRYVDSGPLLCLGNETDKRLTKAERYGNPFERPIFTSSIDPAVFEQTVYRFFKSGYGAIGMQRKQRWGWSELNELNTTALSTWATRCAKMTNTDATANATDLSSAN